MKIHQVTIGMEEQEEMGGTAEGEGDTFLEEEAAPRTPSPPQRSSPTPKELMTPNSAGFLSLLQVVAQVMSSLTACVLHVQQALTKPRLAAHHALSAHQIIYRGVAAAMMDPVLLVKARLMLA
jgi:hypothetical protein